jgi:hydrogenase expression/formation protein HypC
MCLGVPSRVVTIAKNPLGMTMAEVEAGGVVRQVCLDYVPGTAVGDFVMVQMGFAVSNITEAEAGEVLAALGQIVDLSPLDETGDVDSPTPGAST